MGRATAPAWRRRLWPAGLPALLAAPALLVVFLVIGIPLVYSLTLSLHRINPLTQRWIFVGFGNYAQILPDPDFLAAFGRTAYFAVVTVLGGLALGMAMALVLNMSFVGRNILRSLVLVPWAMSPVAVGILWSWMLNGEYGTFNAVLLSLGVIHEPIHWLGNGTLAFNFVALAHIWNQAPLTSLVIVMEMTTQHAMVLPLMITAAISTAVSKLLTPPLYQTLAQRYAPPPVATPVPASQ